MSILCKLGLHRWRGVWRWQSHTNKVRPDVLRSLIRAKFAYYTGGGYWKTVFKTKCTRCGKVRR